MELKSKVQVIVDSLNKFQISSFITNKFHDILVWSVLIYFIVRYGQILLQHPVYLPNINLFHSYTQNKKLPLLLMTNSRAHFQV